jgi:integrase
MLTRTRQSDIRHRRAGLSLHTRQAASRILHPDPPSSNATRTRPHTVTAERSHTAALRMSRDDALSLRDVQTILGHAHLSTTGDVYLVEDEDRLIGRVHRHLEAQRRRAQQSPRAALGYDAAALAVLLGDKR